MKAVCRCCGEILEFDTNVEFRLHENSCQGNADQERQVLPGIPYAAYVALPGVRPSSAKWALVSAHNYHVRSQLPALEPSDDMVIGTAVHAVFAGEAEQIAIWTGKTRRGNDWEDFVTANAGKLLMTEDMYERYDRASTALLSHDVMAESVDGREVSILWQSQHVQAKGRIDSLSPTRIHDLKLTYSIQPHLLARRAVEFGYLMQAAAYSEATGGLPVSLVWQESRLPYDTVVTPISDEAMAFGRRQWLLATERIRHGLDTGEWPRQEGFDLELPAWAIDDEEVEGLD